MRYLLRNKDTHVVHDAIQEGGGKMVLMMTKCGLMIRWDTPHPRWERARVMLQIDTQNISCRKCKAN